MKLKDIEKLHNDGIITEEQKATAIERYKLDAKSSARWLFHCLVWLGAALIAGGVGTLIAAHWHDISPLTKMSGAMLTLAAAWVAYFLLRKPFPLLAEGIAMLGGLLWLANIALLGDIFIPGTPVVEAAFVFFAGIVFLPFLSRQRFLIGVVAITSFVLYFMMTEETDSWLSLKILEHSLRACFTGSLCIALFWWLIAERSCDAHGVTRGYFWVGIPAFIYFLAVAQSFLLYNNDQIYTPECLPCIYAAIPLVLLLLKPRSMRWLPWGIFTAATAVLMPLAEFFCWRDPIIPGLIICAGYAIVLMAIGTRSGRISWINYGSLMAIFTFYGLLSNLLKSLDTSGLVLIISGILLLGFSVTLEKQRRRLVRKAMDVKQSKDTPQEPSNDQPNSDPHQNQ